MYEASRELVWLRNMTGHVLKESGMAVGQEKEEPMIIYKDNAACIAQLKEGYIKGDRTKHILPMFFFTHDLQKAKEVQVVQVRSSDNSADLFTKSLSTSTFRKLVN
ncbi:uncharacterized protein LOC125592629 [Brassica napus]|uniref:uncharacterized protein LOC125592629 n=1 Tax=Brassica napus TaxID=3708 RepID=UPI00207AF169|nr:uncharacterized protein LOC125592629 [Brassica napus]